MKPHLKSSLPLIVAAALALYGVGANAQDTATSRQSRAADFAAKEQAMQDASRSSAAGAVASPVAPSMGLNRNKDAGKAAFESEMMLQKNKPSPKMDRNAKASDPIKSISKMTPEERAQLRAEVVKEAKP